MDDEITYQKVDKCPSCESDDLSDYWKEGRKLQQYCCNCSWHGPIRTPEIKPVTPIKIISANYWYGWTYEIFDKYGHRMIVSRSYNTREEAISKMVNDYERNNNEETKPMSIVLWPPTVEVKGELFNEKEILEINLK